MYSSADWNVRGSVCGGGGVCVCVRVWLCTCVCVGPFPAAHAARDGHVGKQTPGPG